MLQRVIAVILSVIWACGTSCPSSVLLCAVALAPALRPVGLTLKSLSDSKGHRQSNAPLMKDLITLYSMCAFKEPVSHLCWPWWKAIARQHAWAPCGGRGIGEVTLGRGPWLFWAV